MKGSQSLQQFLALLVLGVLIGFYVVLIATTRDNRVLLLLFIVPVVLGAVTLKNSSRIYLIVLVVSLALGARLRLGGVVYRPGGAEASVAPIDLPLAGLLILWMIQVALGKQKLTLRFSGVGIAFFLLVLVHIASVSVAYDSNLALLELLRLIKMGLLVLAISHFVKSENDLQLVLGVLLGMVIFEGVLAVSQSFFNTSLGLAFLGERETFWIQEQDAFVFGRAGGTLGHANVLGYYFELTVPIALAVFIWCRARWLKIVSLLAVGLGVFGVFLTYSRASWVSTLIGLSLVVLATTLVQKRNRLRNLRYIVLVVLAVVVIGFAFKDSIFQRLDLFSSSSWEFRVQTFEIAWSMIQAEPLLGIGANNYLTVLPAYNYARITSLVAETPVHNVLFLLVAETGVLGLLALTIFLIGIGRRGYRVARTGDGLIAASAIGTLAGIIALAAHSMLDWLFRFDPVYTLFWFNVGLLLALRGIQRRTQQEAFAAKENKSSVSD